MPFSITVVCTLLNPKGAPSGADYINNQNGSSLSPGLRCNRALTATSSSISISLRDSIPASTKY